MLKASDIAIKGKTAQEIAAALAQVGQSAILAEVNAELSWEVWDRKTPINGVPAEEVLKRFDIPLIGEIYLIKASGQVLYFQPHDPVASGLVAITKDGLKMTADRHVAKIAEGMADNETMRRVISLLAEKRI